MAAGLGQGQVGDLEVGRGWDMRTSQWGHGSKPAAGRTGRRPAPTRRGPSGPAASPTPERRPRSTRDPSPQSDTRRGPEIGVEPRAGCTCDHAASEHRSSPRLGAGALAGLGVALPLGAIGVLIVQEGITGGWRPASAAGTGVALVDGAVRRGRRGRRCRRDRCPGGAGAVRPAGRSRGAASRSPSGGCWGCARRADAAATSPAVPARPGAAPVRRR